MADVKKEKTFVMIKPDGVQRSLIGEIIKRFERTGLKLVAMKLTFATEEQCIKHYSKDDAWCESKGQIRIKNLEADGLPTEKSALEYGRDIIKGLYSYMTAGPVVLMVWEGNKAVGIIKKIVGGTEPLTSDVGTIRGDFTIDSYDMANLDSREVRNIIHCTDKPEEAEREINIWFTEKELLQYKLISNEILYDINLDGIKE